MYSRMNGYQLLFNCHEVEGMVQRVASGLNDSIPSKNVPIVVTVMTGGLIFAGNLIPKLNFKLEIDYLHATRYGTHEQGKEVRWLSEPLLNPKGRDVIILDDILDEGITLEHILLYYKAREAKSITIAVLLWKNFKSKLIPNYFGEMINDHFVYGYGMDLDGTDRNYPDIRYKI